MPTVDIIRDTLYGMKNAYALRKVSIFGSFADGRATSESDLDLLVEFDSPAVSLVKLNALKYDLEDALGLPVDVIHAPLPEGSMITVGKVVRVL
ncbi:MAG: nucleotidyltransferase domain-containing protein [Clostridia bacterium]|nr:nucleotidyltransferase domain-containing protein [Clostridia bacterium]